MSGIIKGNVTATNTLKGKVSTPVTLKGRVQLPGGNVGGALVYVQDNEPLYAPDGSVWINMSEDDFGDPAPEGNELIRDGGYYVPTVAQVDESTAKISFMASKPNMALVDDVTVTLPAGKDGVDGKDGKDGVDGSHGKNGVDGKDGVDGAAGKDGVDGVSPVVSVEEIEGGHRVTFTDKYGTHTFNVMDGEEGPPASKPTLTEEQKAALAALADAYHKGNANFFYDSNIAHNNYANNSCWDSSKSQFGLCCNTFVAFVWMGREATDFIGKDGTSYSNRIKKAFDWGYMFTFPDRRAIAGAAKRDENGKVTEYYNFIQPNGDDTWSYSTNSRYDSSYTDATKYPNHQRFNSFLNTDCVAQELYRMGCEIPYAELDVGDLVFTKERWKADSEKKTFENNIRWRNISHVLMVLEKAADGTMKFIECSYPVEGMPIFKCSTGYDSVWNTARAIDVIGNVAMCARHPAAFGKSNMSDIEYIDHVPMAYNTGYSQGQAIPFVPGVTVTAGLWYVYDNELGTARNTGTATAWDSANFDIQYTNA